MATVREDDRKAERGQWTLKSKLLDPETVNAVRLAATKVDMALGDWAATKLREAALAELGRPVEKPQPPARFEDVKEALLAAVNERLAPLELLAERLASPPAPPLQYPRNGYSGDTERETRLQRVARRRRK
jgi:hypothetical protein